jgi:hypothetical protein
MDKRDLWPPLPYDGWAETCSALHLWCQVAGKYALAHTPWLNHSWHATFRTTASGLASGLVPDGGGIQISFDLQNHRIIAGNSAGQTQSFELSAMSVAQFHERFCDLIASLGGQPKFNRVPNEVVDAIPFDEDRKVRPYDAGAVSRFHRALVSIALVLERFRTGFIGKASPVHLFWGSFDLAVSRFSGNRAPLHPGGVPNLPDDVTREAYSHEVSSAGFWPGGGGPVLEPCFYSYIYPEPPGFRDSVIAPEAA